VRLPLFLQVAARLLRHEPDPRDGARLAAATLWLWLRSRAGRSGPPVTVRVSAGGRRATLKLWTYVDMLVVRELFLDGDYRVPADRPVRTVLDLGANVGISVRYLLARFPGARLIAVEPDPRLVPRLRANVAGLPAVAVHAAAVAPSAGTATFFSTPEGWSSSLSAAAGGRPVTVRCMTVAEILRAAGLERVDLVKLDIEGGEWPLLDSGAIQRATGCVVGELHHRDPHESVERARRAFAGWAFTLHATHGSGSTFTAIAPG
jgi:FkbM family methyltransferase